MRTRTRRGWMIGGAAVLLGTATLLVMGALRDSLIYFRAPSELIEQSLIRPGLVARVGGLVLENSVAQDQSGATRFSITDRRHQIPVITRSPPPDLFAEGEGVVAEGRFLPGGVFEASRVLARHDENYMPREAYEALRRTAVAAEPARP